MQYVLIISIHQHIRDNLYEYYCNLIIRPDELCNIITNFVILIPFFSHSHTHNIIRRAHYSLIAWIIIIDVGHLETLPYTYIYVVQVYIPHLYRYHNRSINICISPPFCVQTRHGAKVGVIQCRGLMVGYRDVHQRVIVKYPVFIRLDYYYYQSVYATHNFFIYSYILLSLLFCCWIVLQLLLLFGDDLFSASC